MNDPSTDPQFSDPGPGVEPGPPAEAPAVERYRREGLLGLGGMGRVYAARDRVLHRRVALKVAASPGLASRLEREARVTAQLEHPSIVAVYDAGVEGGQAWYVMRMIRGRTLRERIAACPDLSARLALLPHLHAACQAVAYAHAMGIVHRDLTPSNLIVGEFGETQVADWGLACPTEAAWADWERLAPGVSATDGGTVGFMSPEQAEGLPAQPSGDVYALGAALCELLGGGAGGAASSPLDGASDRLLALPADAPPELVAIARRCLQTVAADRYPTAVELADDLGRWMSGQRVLAHEYRPREILGRLVRAWRAPLLVAAAALVLLVGVAAVGIERTLREQARAEENLALALQARQALSEYRNPEAVVLAAHSLLLAESQEARGVLAGAFHEQALLLDRQPLPAGCAYQGVLSRNGDRIACVVDGQVEVWRFGPLRRELSLEVQVDSAPVWVGDRLLMVSTQAAVWVDGSGVGQADSPGGVPVVGDDGVYLLAGPLVSHLDLDGTVRRFQTCQSTRASTTVADGELVVGCADGFLRSYTRDGVLTRERVISEGPPDWASVGHAAGKLLIGGFDGSVRTYDLESGVWSPPVPGGASARCGRSSRCRDSSSCSCSPSGAGRGCSARPSGAGRGRCLGGWRSSDRAPSRERCSRSGSSWTVGNFPRSRSRTSSPSRRACRTWPFLPRGTGWRWPWAPARSSSGGCPTGASPPRGGGPTRSRSAWSTWTTIASWRAPWVAAGGTCSARARRSHFRTPRSCGGSGASPTGASGRSPTARACSSTQTGRGGRSRRGRTRSTAGAAPMGASRWSSTPRGTSGRATGRGGRR